MTDKNKANTVAEQETEKMSIWKRIGIRLWQMFNPFAHGIVFGTGSTIGAMLIRFFVLQRLDLIQYKNYSS